MKTYTVQLQKKTFWGWKNVGKAWKGLADATAISRAKVNIMKRENVTADQIDSGEYRWEIT